MLPVEIGNSREEAGINYKQYLFCSGAAISTVRFLLRLGVMLRVFETVEADNFMVRYKKLEETVRYMLDGPIHTGKSNHSHI